MSCTVVALPVMLAHVLALTVVAKIKADTEVKEEVNAYSPVVCDTVDVISAKHFIEKRRYKSREKNNNCCGLFSRQKDIQFGTSINMKIFIYFM